MLVLTFTMFWKDMYLAGIDLFGIVCSRNAGFWCILWLGVKKDVWDWENGAILMSRQTQRPHNRSTFPLFGFFSV
jgi:hypothetical protein